VVCYIGQVLAPFHVRFFSHVLRVGPFHLLCCLFPEVRAEQFAVSPLRFFDCTSMTQTWIFMTLFYEIASLEVFAL